MENIVANLDDEEKGKEKSNAEAKARSKKVPMQTALPQEGEGHGNESQILSSTPLACIVRSLVSSMNIV